MNRSIFSLTNYLPEVWRNCLRHPANILQLGPIIDLKVNFCRTFLGSHSQYAEDVVIYNLLKKKKTGIYIDIGANDPDIINNTKFFYLKGWRGINIEPDIELFNKIMEKRPEDTNLNLGVASKSGEMNFYRMCGHTSSSFNEDFAKSLEKSGCTLKEIIKRPVCRLDEIMNMYVKDRQIDFMSVDVEGLDLDVLQSNDWSKYRPKLIIIEINHDEPSLINYLQEQDYKLAFKNHTNGIFCDAKN